MRRLTYKISGILFLVLFISLGQLIASEATKTISKSFDINGDTKIEIKNKHGNVVISRWDKNVVDLKVKIDAKGKTDAKTQKILDAIEIDISDRVSSGRLSFETEIGDISGNSSFSINYEVTMPYTNPLSVNHSFGNVFMGSHKGDLDVTVKHGQFQAEDLDNANIHIEFSYARCEVETLKSGKLDLAHSKMKVEDMGDVEINTQFSDLEIENAGSISLYAKHGKFEMENIRSFKGDIEFAGLDIGNLEESIFLGARHGNGINIEKVSNRFKNIEIEAEFSSIDINLESGAAATLDFELQFGNLKAYGDDINFDKVIKDQNSSSYKGYLVNSDASSSINVSTRHGNIRLDVD
jgi:hypothetical protein